MMNDTISGESSMQTVLHIYPGAQRALFRKYHIGGCSSCGFQSDETLEGVCKRNGDLPVNEVLDQIKQSHEEDARILIEPADLDKRLKNGEDIHLVDIRSREEFEAVHINDSFLLTQPLMQEILGSWNNDQRFVMIDHKGQKGLDAAAYYLGHGMPNVHALRGGIDAWSLEVDSSIRRYSLS
ncbi:MAG: rhodanese-like domain-containing protein [Verrucomicrobiota bacterium]|nr:rhodanese-like domain-containing protein [Verrucomicrobiota bacterium]